MNDALFREVRATTFAVPDPERSATYCTEWLGYTVMQNTRVPDDLAHVWKAPDVTGHKMLTLGPASGANTYLRFIEAPEVPGYGPLLTHGWNAAELHVQDVDGLANRLQGSPFEILGMPRNLNEAGAVRAMQVVAPQGEVLYLTEVKHKGYQRAYGRAETPVDRAFIIVLGSANYDATIQFYQSLGHKIYEYGAYTITVLARAHGLDPATEKFDMATVGLAGKFRIEIDSYPDCAVPRPVPGGRIPPGLGIVSFTVEDLDAIDLPFRSIPATIDDDSTYGGKRRRHYSRSVWRMD